MAGGAVAALAAGTLVTAGLVSQPAAADGPAPGVSISVPETYVAGEDVDVALTFTSAGPAAGDQYNLSFGLLLPEDVTVVGTGTLGAPTVYPLSPADRIVPGTYAQIAGDCSALGLEPASPMPPAPNTHACQVPAGMQYLVFQNISDLPENASTTHTLSLRPRADSFPVGSDLPLRATAYTSGDERFIPVFPGSMGVATSDDDTSAPGSSALNVPVNALRVEKREPSPEHELLRGVHENSTTYTIRVHHTGEGDIASTKVVDFLPAGLEYLGLGDVDNTTNANGTQGVPAEYPGAAPLTATPAPAPAAGSWQSAGETVETVIPTAQEVADYGLQAGAVYTKVTWDLGTLLATGDARDTTAGTAQSYASAAGTPGLIEIRYRAGVPLFENTLDFGTGAQQPAVDGAQTANLDNNRGASTRHGDSDTAEGDAPAKQYTNVAAAEGAYDGATVRSSGSTTIDAVDLRVVKSVDNADFRQTGIARYTLDLARSEYTTATVPGPAEAPYGLVDDLSDGICPVFPDGTPVAAGASTHAGTPNLIVLGDSSDPDVGDDKSAAEWNAVLATAQVNSDCAWTLPAGSDAVPGLVGAEVVSIAFDKQTGHFQLGLSVAPGDALVTGKTHQIVYSARQNERYLDQTGGMTTSGDTVMNHVEIVGRTESIDALDGVTSAGSTHPDNPVPGDVADGVWNASDDSDASLRAGLTRLDKQVLQRDAVVPDIPGGITTVPAGQWVKTADNPFAVGDEVWYRVVITPPSGADVRNPKFTDFLPPGVAFDSTDANANGIPDDMWIVPSSARGLGTCQPANAVEWVNDFVPAPDVNGNALTFNLGNNCGLGGTDRFLPLDTSLTIYLKVTVTEQSAFGQVDLSENLAKYQQNNVEGDIFFLRDAAEVKLAQSLRLIKGVRSIDGTPVPGGDVWNGNVDHRQVVQGDAVTYRLDLTAPEVGSTDYVIWDALPAGITRADVLGADPATGVIATPNASAATVTGTGAVETPLAPAGWTATVYDFGDAGYPADLRGDVAGDQRSVIVWTIDATVPRSIPAGVDPAVQQGLTLGYTVVIPDGTDPDGGPAAILTQEYVNDAGIVQYASVSNGSGANPVLVPEGPDALFTGGAGAGQYEIEDALTFDPSDVYLPDATMAKRLVSTEIRPTGTTPADPYNTASTTAPLADRPDDVVTEGEYATFEYAVTIPARTSVAGAKLSDGGAFAFGANQSIDYEYVAGSAEYFAWNNSGETPSDCGAGELAGFTCAETVGDEHGVLNFPAIYTNDSDEPQTFRVRITVWVDTNDGTVAGLWNGANLRNTATFGFADPNGGTAPIERTATAEVQYRQPELAIAKTANPATDVEVGQPVAYTLTVTNGDDAGNRRVKSYDNVVVDTVPVGLIVDEDSFTVGGASIPLSALTFTGDVFTGGGGTITWSYESIPALAEIPSTATLGYIAEIDPQTGAGRSYENTADVTGRTLPDTVPNASERRGTRTSDDDATITAITAAIDKGVRVRPQTGDPAYAPTASAPIGETVQYRVDVTLNANINYYDVRVRDMLPTDVTMDASSVRVTLTPEGGSPADITADWTRSGTGQPYNWVYTPSGGDILSAAQTRTLTFTYDVLLASGVTGNSLPNTADFTWATADGGALRDPISDAATVNVLNPVLAIQKDVQFTGETDAWRQGATGNPDRGLEYRVRVSNTGNTPAYHATVTDTVPAGVVVDPASISNGGVLTGNNPTTGGGTITWSNLPGPIPVGAEQLLSYRATFAPSANLTSGTNGQGALLTNTARVTHYESFPRDPANPDTRTGREYNPTNVSDTAEARALFPRVDLTKAAADASHTAYVGEPFEWVLTARNSGQGAAQQVVLTDTLPANWTFTEVTQVTIGGVNVPLSDPRVTPTGAPNGPLVWTFGSDATAGAPAAVLQPGQSIVIRYTATPTDPDALTAPGVGNAHPHTNTLSAVTSDRTNATANQSRSHTGPNASDDAFLREANLLLQKDGIGGVTDSAAWGGLAMGTWIAGQTATTGYAQPQWRITVTNQGPNDGYGPFILTDTMPTLPAGVSVSSWTARLYSSPTDTTGTSLGTFSGTGPFTLGNTTTRLLASGSNRIELVANVTIGTDAVVDALPSALALSNTASVTGRTYENPANLGDNTDSDTKTVAQLADLVLAKDISSPVPPTVPAVGSQITWQIAVSNAGPSASLSTAASPIVITDTVPAGMTGVTATSNGDWTAALADGSAIPAEGVGAGTVIRWTYTGDAMPVGATAPLSLTGTILTSHTGPLTNAALVTAGDTPERSTTNNADDVTVTPNDATTLSITKARVVPDGAGGWRQIDPAEPADAFVAGDPVHYRITVENHGPADARAVTVVDEAPAGLSYDTHANVTGTWSYASGGTTSEYPGGAPAGRTFSTFTLTGTQLAGGANRTSFVVTYDTDPALTGAVVNWAEVTADNWDPTDPSGPFDRDDDSTGSTRIVDLGIVKSHTGTGPFTPGTEVEYTLVVTNHGPSVTNGAIEIADSLPAGLSYVANSATVTVPGDTTAPTDPNPALGGLDDRVLTWSLLDDDDTFGVNATITVTFRALIDPTVRESAMLTNTATVDGPDTEPDPDPHANRDDDAITTGPTAATMTLVKSVTSPAAPGPYLAGTEVAYTLTVENTGVSAVPASVTDTLPDGLTLVSMSGANWDCSAVVPGSTAGTCAYLNSADTNPVTRVLHPLGTSTITVVAAIAPSVATGTELVNGAVLSWVDGGGTHTRDDDAPITVTTDADLGIVKDVIDGPGGTVVPDPAPATAGETAWYRLQVTNHGPSDAIGPITVTDVLPLGVTVPASLTSVGPWTVTPGPVDPGVPQTVTFELAGGQTAATSSDAARGVAPVIEFEADLDPTIAHGALLVNDASVASPTPDSNPGNDDDDAAIEASRSVDLAITKTHPSDDAGQVRIDEPLDFTLVVTNGGPSEATGITVTDTVPAGLEVTSVVGPVLDADDQPTGWTIDSIDLIDPDDPLGGTVVVASYASALGVIAPGDEAEPLVISTIVRESALGTEPNRAVVSGIEADRDPSNNEAEDPLDVRPRVTLVVSKTAVSEFQVGKTGAYAIMVENLGPHADPGPITVVDELPAGLSYHSSPALPAGVDVQVSGNVVTWTLTDGLAVDESVTLSLVVNVHEAAYPEVVNSVTIDSPAEKTPESVLSDDETVPVKAADPLSTTGSAPVAYLALLAALLLLAGGVVTAVRRPTRREG